MSFSDPVPFNQGPLAPIEQALEEATDALVEAADEHAEAQCQYLEAVSIAWLHADHVAITARGKHCDNQPAVVPLRCAFVRAEARERACRAKCEELKTRLMACMSWQRTVGSQT